MPIDSSKAFAARQIDARADKFESELDSRNPFNTANRSNFTKSWKNRALMHPAGSPLINPIK